MMSNPLPSRIDVHSHFLPDFYQDACQQHGHANPDGMPYLPKWDPGRHMAMMDAAGIQKSILSISSPGTHLVAGDDAFARKLTRDCNRYAAELKKREPTRFGYFASLPLPDVEGSLTEIAVAVQEGCDGFALETNYHGHYLGDPLFDPVFDALNRRGAVLFIHPTTPMCVCPESTSMAATGAERTSQVKEGKAGQGSQPQASVHEAAPIASRGYPNPMLEFFFDTARVVTHLFMSGTVRRCPDLRIILPHLGGSFVPMLSRWTGISGWLDLPCGQATEEEVRAALQRQFWFDLAGFVFPGQIRAVMAGAGVTIPQMLYGSDFPFTSEVGVNMLRRQMDEGVKELFSDEEIEDLYHRNADKLLSMT